MEENMTTTKAYVMSYKDAPAYEAAQVIWKVVPPILIIVGLFGNTMSVIVFSRREMRRSNISAYFVFLAFVDTTTLIVGCLRQWLIRVADVDVRYLSLWGCRFHIWMVYVCTDLASWTLVVVTFERALSIWFPYGGKFRGGKVAGLITLGIITLCLGILNGHYLVGLDSVTNSDNSTRLCTSVGDGYKKFKREVWPWLDLCALALVPFLLLVLGNGSIVYKVVKSKRALGKTGPAPSTLAVPKSGPKKSNKTSSMTIMLLIVNFVFFVGTFPMAITLLCEEYWASDDPYITAYLSFNWAMVNMTMYANNSLNFFLYCLSGSRFRKEFMSIFIGRDKAFGTEISRTGAPSKAPSRSVNTEVVPMSDKEC